MNEGRDIGLVDEGAGAYETELLPAFFPEDDSIRQAAALIRAGELVAFPTETVYGLGANGYDPKAVEKIFMAKGRPQDNPLILHIDSEEMLREVIYDIDEKTLKSVRRLWPGPITMIFEKSPRVPDIVTAGLSTVAVRLPMYRVAQSFISKAGVPIAAPSANRSGRPSPTTAKDVLEDMDGRIPLILDAGPSSIGLESTVVDLTSYPPTILRPGFYPHSLLQRFFPDLRGGEDQIMDGETQEKPVLSIPDSMTPKAPGLKYRHYAPNAHVTVYVGEVFQITERMKEAAATNAGFLVFSEQEEAIRDAFPEAPIRVLGSYQHLDVIGQRLFRLLREIDRLGVQEIYVAGVPEAAYGVAIMNRLSKAAGGNVIHV